jgi:phosphinothricin acetyltransferase
MPDATALPIRAARANDAEGIAAIYNHYIAHTIVTFELDPVTAEAMQARITTIQAQGLPWLVAEQGGSIAGYAYAGPWRPRAAYRHSVEVSVYLAPEAIGRGIGSTLYRGLIGVLHACDVHAAIGGIALPNPASVLLHERLGFVQVAHFRQVGRKFGRWIDVGYWQLLLADVA